MKSKKVKLAMDLLLALSIVLVNYVSNAKTLEITQSGEKVSTGNNWTISTSGSAATISFSASASIHPHVIETLLNSGKKVFIQGEGDIQITSPISKTGYQLSSTLTFTSKANGKIIFNDFAKINATKGMLNVFIHSENEIIIPPTAGIYSNGGLIRLQAIDNKTSRKSPTTNIDLSGIVSASSSSIGGKIIIEADAIALNSSAKILAKGHCGGGTILIGGDWQNGANTAMKDNEMIYEAITIQMKQGAIIDASATENGNGGKVVLWSNLNNPRSNTSVQGNIFAMGKGKGKGGMIETSGGAVDFDNINVSTLAADGSAGEWLIDPWNFFFNSSQLGTLASNLSSTDITISTANSSASGSPTTRYGMGHIVFHSNFTYTGSNARTLTLTTNEDIWIEGNITSTGGALGLRFNAPTGKRIFINGDINTNGGLVRFDNGAFVHFQKSSGDQTVNANGINFNGVSNLRLLRHNGTLTLNSGTGSLNIFANGTVEQTNTRFLISAPSTLVGWGGRHTNGTKVYTPDIVAGREYTVRIYYWPNWVNGEVGRLGIRTGTSTNNEYYRASKNTANNTLENIVVRSGVLHQQVQPAANDVYAEITFVAQHTGKLYTMSPSSGSEIEVFNLRETTFSTTTHSTGSRSLVMASNGGRPEVRQTEFVNLANITFNIENNNFAYLDGIISGSTNVIKNGSGRIRFSGENTYTGTTTVNAGRLRFVPNYSGTTSLTGDFINNAEVTYQASDPNRAAIFLNGNVSGTGTWTINSSVAPLSNTTNRLIFRGNATTSGQITVTDFGNFWLERNNINLSSSIHLDGTATRLRLYGAVGDIIRTGSITGTGTVDFPSGGGGNNLTLAINTGSANAQFDGVISNTGISQGPTTLNIRKEGTGTYTLTQNHTYSGTTAINAGTLVLQNDAPNPSNKTFNGTGQLRIEPTANSFSSAFAVNGWTINPTLSGLSIGKSTNTENVTLDVPTTIAGPISVFGGTVAIQENLIATATGSAIQLHGTRITQNSAVDVQTNGGDIGYTVVNAPWTTANNQALRIGSGGTTPAQILAHGGNIQISASFESSGTSGGIDRAIFINNATIATTGSGTITLVGDASNNASTGSNSIWGITFDAGGTIRTETGKITLDGTGGKAAGNSRGVICDAKNARILSSSGDIEIIDREPSGLTGDYRGLFLRPINSSNILIGADGTDVTSSSSNLSIQADKMTFEPNSSSLVQVNTSGDIVLESVGSSFSSDLNQGVLTINGDASSLRIGKPSNTANVTFVSSTSIAGPITAYGGSLTLNESIASSNGGTIAFYGNQLNFASGKTVSSTGQLIVAPQTASNTIGIGGASGTLALPASYFSTNFSDGFSNIQIGSNAQTGAISTHAFTLRDNMTFLTSGSLTLEGNPVLGNNNVTLGSAISSINLGSPAKYFQTNGAGTVNRNIDNASAFDFPVGNSAFNPVKITNKNNNADLFGVRVLDEVYENGTSGNVLSSKPRIKRTWDISKAIANSGDGVDFEFTWNSGEEDNLNADHRLYHFGTRWDLQTGTTNVHGTTLSYTGYKGSFSPFAIGNEATPLPVSLLSFDVEKTNQGAQLYWSTTTEINNSGFEIMKSSDGQNWNPIGFVAGAGNSYQTQQYQFIDYNLKPLAYYKLKQIDYDGNFNYSPIRMLYAPSALKNQVLVYPNPSKGAIQLSLVEGNTANFELYDALGKRILSGMLLPAETQSLNLSKGLYFLKVHLGTMHETHKIVVE